MECVERKPLVRPIWEQLDELAATDEILGPEREDLRHSVTGGAGAQHRADVVRCQAAGNRDPQFLPTTVKFPWKRPAGDRVQVVNAFVPPRAEVAGMSRAPVPGQVGGCGAGKDPGLKEPPGDER
jgi:hypothetical protein